MKLSSWKAFPLSFAVAGLFLFGIGAACEVTSEDDFGGGGPESDTFIPEGGSDTFIPEGGSDTFIPESGSDTTIPEGGSDTTIPEGGDSIESLMRGTVDSIDADAGQMVLALTGSDTVDVNLDQTTSVSVNGSPGTLEDLQPGDSVQVEVNQNTNVAISIMVLSETMDTDILPQTQQGTVESVDASAGHMVLALAGGGSIEVNVDQETLVHIDSSMGLLQDLQPGDSVQVEIDQYSNSAASIVVLSQATSAEEMQLSQIGTVDHIDADSGQMVLALTGSDTVDVNFDQNTSVTVSGTPGSLQDLQLGDSVEVIFDQDTNVAASITVEVEPVTTGGEIQEIDLASQTITMVTPEGELLHLGFLVLDGSTEIIVEGGQGTLHDLASGASVEVTYDPETLVISEIYVRPG